MSSPATPDAVRRSVVDILPTGLQPWARLARLDRPIGTWLLFWPCVWGVFLAGEPVRDIYLVPLFFVGALVMRSAGCVYNDIVDRDLDARVERTRDRPLASGAISVRGAWIFLVLLCLIGLLVLVQLNLFAALIALGSLGLVAAYPFMKRITWWPQAWLGLTFNWGALVGYAAATGTLNWAAGLLYLAGIFWTLGYDTIYALQDMEDDAFVGIKSSARRLGANTQMGVGAFYAAMEIFLFAALWIATGNIVAALIGATLGGIISLMHVRQLSVLASAPALALFRASTWTGLLVTLGIVAAFMLAK
jgi:4-hydroxybenzoate polyprenyltransferase|tara:strand:+ start:8989 stop:9903 length:915 start_codon:yes stop_codon:yes gene_type:complete